MPGRHFRPVLLTRSLAIVFMLFGARAAAQQTEWPIHSMERPRPVRVDPGPAGAPVPPPSDAIVLFDGTNLSRWKSSSRAGGPARWKIENGYMEVVPGTGGIETVDSFGDIQLHIEWASPATVEHSGQDRGNSGVFLMRIYEVQVLDSNGNDTYPDGQAGALYGREPPLVNATRPPGQWQSYDIIFRAPRFDADGKVLARAQFTVFHNNILIHDAVELEGPTANKAKPPYTAHAARLPISLQDHDGRVRFRNIWVRELK